MEEDAFLNRMFEEVIRALLRTDFLEIVATSEGIRSIRRGHIFLFSKTVDAVFSPVLSLWAPSADRSELIGPGFITM